MIVHDGAVHFFKIFGHIRSPFFRFRGSAFRVKMVSGFSAVAGPKSG
jgi:hypothetical protein